MVDENSTFGGFLTDIGEARQANANALGIPWKLTHMLLGDANGNDPVPDPAQAGLINQRYRAAINQLSVDPANPAILIAELVLPPDVGGWWIRELGLEDDAGNFVAVANCAPSYKPLLAQGSGRTQVVRMHLILSNTANVELKIDPSIVLATRAYVDDEITEHAESRNHPAATTTALGFVEKATLTEAKNGAADKFPDAAGVKAAIIAARSTDQFATYDAARTYTTGEIARGGDGQFYEFYDRDQAGTVQNVDPADPLNRPHIWMEWDGAKPGSTIEWRSETLPEGYVENDGAAISRAAYRRVFAVHGTIYGVGDGATTFNVPDDRAEFKRGWDHGRGVDLGRSLQTNQGFAFEDHFHFLPTSTGSEGGHAEGAPLDAVFSDGGNWGSTLVPGGNGDNASIASDTLLRTYRSVVGPTGAIASETRPRNNAVIYLTKI